jgi:hypothetical protein
VKAAEGKARARFVLHSLYVLAHLDVFNHVHGVCEIMDAAGVFASPSTSQETR